MNSLRGRLAAHRERLIAQAAELRSELAADCSALHQKVSVVSKIAALVPLVRPIASMTWRHYWRRRAQR